MALKNTRVAGFFVLAALLAMLAPVATVHGETFLIDFTASYCGPCQRMKPTVHRLQGDGYPVRVVDIEQHPDTARQYGVDVVPTFVLVSNNKIVSKITGATSYETLQGMFATAGYSPNPQQIAQPRAGKAGPTVQNTLAREYSNPGIRNTSNTINDAGRSYAAPPRNAAEKKALYASVRIKVEDANGHSFGTGTIIDVHGREALILTCGHLFRESKGAGRITVEFLFPGAPGPIPAQLIRYDADKYDIGLLAIKPGVAITAAKIGGVSFQPRVGDAALSVGCDRGGEPTVKNTRITHVNRYGGASNVEAAGAPVEGRSGGGLFTADGVLIGVCNAADHQDDEGIYAGLPSIQYQLEQIGQRHIFDPPAIAKNNADNNNQFEPQPEPSMRSFENRFDTRPEPNINRVARNADGVEVIVIVKPKNAGAKSNTIILDNPSKVFMDKLEDEQTQQEMKKSAGYQPGGLQPRTLETGQRVLTQFRPR